MTSSEMTCSMAVVYVAISQSKQSLPPILLVFPCPSASVVVVVVFGSNVAIADVIGEGNTGSVAVVVGSNVAIDEGNNVVVVVDVVSGSVVVGSNVATAAAVVVVCVVVESKSAEV